MKKPKIARSARLFDHVVVYGDVEISENCSIWPGVVARGDLGTIVIGSESNIQDNCVLHCDSRYCLAIGSQVTVGHMCILHSCTIGSRTTIGMGSILMNGVTVGEDCIIGAGSLLTEGTKVPDGMMAYGRPAKVIRPLTDKEKQNNLHSACEYVDLIKKYNDLIT